MVIGVWGRTRDGRWRKERGDAQKIGPSTSGGTILGSASIFLDFLSSFTTPTISHYIPLRERTLGEIHCIISVLHIPTMRSHRTVCRMS